ncbi:glycosyltransferase family 2 protein [Brevundimonas basaltis]|uniref:Cellulose synthase/poly-beta-1,6-N-acetylglucosamine synthase-like glycosyltransferase n=1 Tax=Brevundimonas basaltis TaxID=472166 RepID=A0A7W8HY19_9CAUL|nr:glycosyltransferase family 2 protein [Brevundimonas basaltis]MBB5291032.1 cellulose synthase/poly-beta-1,6-N-acetylglucosamine synthase-like glycosyltransferase [Brevundimonas basaltis]
MSARLRGLSDFQWLALAGALTAAGCLVWIRPGLIGPLLVAGAAATFLVISCWRVALVILSAGGIDRRDHATADLPRYSVLVALHDEAEVIDQLVERLARIDYPQDRLQGLLILEPHDAPTISAALAASKPGWLEVFVAPPGEPQTKPRALNCALPHVTGNLLTVYDAEDEPDPQQLREAAARFAADAGGNLACLQAPLRIRRMHRGLSPSPFLDRQFAAEYASLFETALPGMARLGLPFPLGGTSNHFRVDVLRAVGGWDAFNVTEDADLGFRLWGKGWRLGVISRPTWETPPGDLSDWLPQRTRWLKGYMQTWGVHTRRPWRLGARGAFALLMTVGAGIVSASVNGPSLAWLATTVLVAAVAGLPPQTPALALVVLILGAASAWLSCAIGARRAGVPYGPTDMIVAPAYWALQSLAAAHAAWRLVREPFAWDKTRHRRDEPVTATVTAPAPAHAALDEAAPERLSAGHAAAPQPVA